MRSSWAVAITPSTGTSTPVSRPSSIHSSTRRRHSGSVAAGPTRNEPVHPQVGEQRAAVVEADQQVLAVGVGLAQHRAGEVDVDEAGVARDAALAALAGEAAVDPLGQPTDRVTLRHP